MMHKILLTLIFSALLSAASVEYYVSPTGNDGGVGTIDKPFATIERAKTAVRDSLSKTDGDIIVYLRGGMHRLTKAVVFEPADGGKGDQRVSYRNFAGEEPIISSGVKVDGWEKLESGNVYVADIPQGIDKFYSLYEGINRLPRARSEGFKPTQSAKDKGIWDTRDQLHYPAEMGLKNWDNINDVEIFIKPWCLWTMNILPLAKVDEDNRIAYTALAGTYPLTRERFERFGPKSVWYENAIEVLDTPGEWVVNTKTRKIYLWPKSDIAASEIYVPTMREYFAVKGDEENALPVRNIDFEGITFVHGERDVWTKQDIGVQHDWEMFDKDNAMLRFRWAQDCTVTGCAFVGAASTGLRLDLYAQNITVKNNMFANLGGSGIVLCGYGPGNKDFNKNNIIENNHIHHIGQLYWHNPAILLFQSGGNRIAHNLIHDTPYNGISIGGVSPMLFDYLKADSVQEKGLQRTIDKDACADVLKREEKTKWKDILHFLYGGDNIIEYNRIHNAIQILGDGNGIYIRMVPGGNVVRRNYFYDTKGFGVAIRPDGDQFDCDISENVIANWAYGGISVQKRNNVANNIIYNASATISSTRDNVQEPGGYIVFATVADWGAPVLEGALVRKNILYHTLASKPVFYGAPNPEWPKDYYDKVMAGYCAPDVDYNVIFWSKDSEGFMDEYMRGIREVRKDDHNSAIVDPMFVDAAGGDFRFKPDSPALKLGIKEIDVREIGLTEDFPKQLERYGR